VLPDGAAVLRDVAPYLLQVESVAPLDPPAKELP